MLTLHAPSDKYNLKTSYIFTHKKRERNLPEKNIAIYGIDRIV